MRSNRISLSQWWKVDRQFPHIYTLGELAAMQKDDFALGEIWKLWERSWQPGSEHHASPEMKKAVAGWVREWSRLVERHGVLYRAINNPGLSEILEVLVPEKLRAELVTAAHDNWGHQGTGRTMGLLRQRCFWPGMSKQVREYIKSCFACTG